MIVASIRIRHLRNRVAAILLVFLAGPAWAQTQPSALDLRLPPPSDLRPQADGGVTIPDERATDTATSVHGSFTSGVGYSKGFGNSTVNAAELDVTKRYDSGRTLDLQIGVLRSTGVPTVTPHDYVSRYSGY